MTRSPAAVTVFAKWPVLGRVKTRLAEGIGPEAAFAFARAFLKDVLARLAPLADCGVDLFLGLDRIGGDPAGLGADSRFRVELQGRGDLGDRMSRCFHRRLSIELRPAALLVGSDLPLLQLDRVVQALRTLERVSLVLGPTGDGGYYMIGLDRPAPELFRRIQWSTPAVLDSTLRAATALGLPHRLLRPLQDVDTTTDLARILRLLRSRPEAAPETWQALQDWRGRLIHPLRCKAALARRARSGG